MPHHFWENNVHPHVIFYKHQFPFKLNAATYPHGHSSTTLATPAVLYSSVPYIPIIATPYVAPNITTPPILPEPSPTPEHATHPPTPPPATPISPNPILPPSPNPPPAIGIPANSVIPPTPVAIPKRKPTQHAHNMVTRANAGIFKPKTYLTALEPSSVKQALATPY